LHRTASACFGNPKRAIVVYQLFWDKKTKSKLASFIELLKKSKDAIKPKPNLSYFVHTIEADLLFHGRKEDVFQQMKNGKAYAFGVEQFMSL